MSFIAHSWQFHLDVFIQHRMELHMRGSTDLLKWLALVIMAALATALPVVAQAQAKPNILFIMGDDIGIIP
ncbi:MAG: hypothetical protein ABI790_18720 [Betaproteobacteria bacterium]